MPETWFTAADVEAASQRLAANGYGGPDDMHDLDPDDVREIVQLVLTATWQSAVAQGRTQATDEARILGHRDGWREATEGWKREHAVRYPDGYVYDDVTAEAARAIASKGKHRSVVSRLVGPWEPAEQTEVGPSGRCRKCSGPLMPCFKCGKAAAQCGEALCVACTPDEPATGGVVEPSGPPTTEEAVPGLGAWLARDEELQADAERAARIEQPAPVRRQHDPGALMEEPDLYRPHAALNERGHLRGCGCEDCERGAEQPEDGAQ